MIPKEIWTGEDCAEYLGIKRGHFMQVVRHRSGFPKPLEFSEGNQPRWYSEEVRKYALGTLRYVSFTPDLRQNLKSA
jgi:hypothetical protein